MIHLIILISKLCLKYFVTEFCHSWFSVFAQDDPIRIFICFCKDCLILLDIILPSDFILDNCIRLFDLLTSCENKAIEYWEKFHHKRILQNVRWFILFGASISFTKLTFSIICNSVKSTEVWLNRQTRKESVFSCQKFFDSMYRFI